MTQKLYLNLLSIITKLDQGPDPTDKRYVTQVILDLRFYSKSVYLLNRCHRVSSHYEEVIRSRVVDIGCRTFLPNNILCRYPNGRLVVVDINP